MARSLDSIAVTGLLVYVDPATRQRLARIPPPDHTARLVACRLATAEEADPGDRCRCPPGQS